MNPQQNTTEQQQLEDLVKLIKLAREEGIPMADNDGRNDHQLACDFLLYLQYASYKLKNGWQNYNLATVTQLYEEKMKMENLYKNNIRFTCNSENSTQIDADYFDFLDYSSNDEYNQVLETNVNDGCTVLKELDLSDSTHISTNSPTTSSSLPFHSDQTYYPTDANISQDSSKYGSQIIAAFLKSDWPSDDEDETPFSTSIKERGKALYEEKRRQAEVASKSDMTYVQVQQALLANEINVNESSKNSGRRLTRNSLKGKRTTTTKATNIGKRSRKHIGTGRQVVTSSGSMTSSGINQTSTTVPGLQVISPCTSLVGFGQQQAEDEERPQTPVRGTKRKFREGEIVAENPALMDFDVNKMFDDFDSAAHAANVTPGTMYNQLLADISPSIRDRFTANSPGPEFDDLWATYGAPANKRLRKSSKGREWTIGFESEISEVRGVAEAGHSSYQASLDAWAASDAASGEVSQTSVEVPSTPPHQIRSATCVRTPGSAFSLSEFLNLSPSPIIKTNIAKTR
ncbi:7926_t:CDS:2 [Funneliformis mosseae]|uniref:7926_t:CDS:1 n=1 Tax=Funneliformis mosseae TaxID=27381 RepID=A0A9N9AHN1_FUNMO|nr:7926_t:CDS:2 [Funneliformis mosseae]